MSDAERLAERLEAQANSASQASRMMAESKSLRQEGHNPPRADLYSWAKPEQTLEHEAAALIRAQSARMAALEDALRGIEEGTIERPILWTYREDGKPSKHDRCIHDVWMYETCAGCIDAHIAKALGKGSE